MAARAQKFMKVEAKEEDKDKAKSPALSLVQGLVFGLIFGFLLQKGGVAKYDILLGALLFTDATVAKVMLSAIIVGMVGIFSMYALGLVKLHVKPTRYAANIIGGLLFGVGFALFGYCPGTGGAALGQGNYDVIAGIVGLMAGSFLFAEASRSLEKKFMKLGYRGNIMFPELLNVRLYPFIFVVVPILMLVLWGVEKIGGN
ncbi:MAG: YeeE/YedE thiosulfate transporter family protein [Candidatus Binatia bacterium]